ncbi:L,D-transpeptidase [Candidatus Dojkabacteria bacterium]|nr:L,D-transpeptidase [Candidatus Dojkabacteria bacterium]
MGTTKIKVFAEKLIDAKLKMENNKLVMPFNNYAIVDLSEQREYVFSDETIYVYRVATGAAENPTPVGVWKIVKYYEDFELSSLYGPCLLKLNYFDGRTWIPTERALHGTNTPDIIGSPESFGCIYHYNDDILKICELFKIGDFVIVIE